MKRAYVEPLIHDRSSDPKSYKNVKNMTTIDSIDLGAASPTDIFGALNLERKKEESKEKELIASDKENIEPIRRKHTDDLGLTNTIIRMSAPSIEETQSNFNQSSNDNSLLRELDVQHRSSSSLTLCNILAGSTIGVGTGLAMMPIFNNELYDLDDYGINIHDIEVLYVISTFNTLICTSLSNIMFLLREGIPSLTEPMKDLTLKQGLVLTAGGIGAFTSSLLPLSLMWDVELNNAEMDGEFGFNKFTAYAAFCSIPLLAAKTIECFYGIANFFKNHDNLKIDSIGGKIAVSVLTVLSTVARSMCFKTTTAELAKDMGFDEETAEIMGIIIGGIIASGTSLIAELNALQNIFKTQETPITKKEIALSVACALEGMWFSLPMISSGLEATQDWNPLLKGALFTPLFVSRSVFEASASYHALKPKSWETKISLQNLRMQEKDKEIVIYKVDLNDKNKQIEVLKADLHNKDEQIKVLNQKSNELVDSNKPVTALTEFGKYIALQNKAIKAKYDLIALQKELDNFSMLQSIKTEKNTESKKILLEDNDLKGILDLCEEQAISIHNLDVDLVGVGEAINYDI
jgi:hypothetical protein